VRRFGTRTVAGARRIGLLSVTETYTAARMAGTSTNWRDWGTCKPQSEYLHRYAGTYDEPQCRVLIAAAAELSLSVDVIYAVEATVQAAQRVTQSVPSS
jgi:hypothetical protein